MLLLILFFLLLSIGLYLFLCSAARLPTISTTITAMRTVHPKEKKGSSIHVIVFTLASSISKWIHLNDDRKSDLEIKLHMAGLSETPQYHVAKIIVNFILWLVVAALLSAISPILGFIVAGYGVYMLTKDISSLDKAIKARRDKIDTELPRFTATLSQELKSNRDIIGIMSSFMPSTTPEFRDELQITLADMRSGSPEKALWRMNKRIGSIMLSEIIRGLQMVLQGDDAVVYFQTLQSDFKQIDLQNLRLIAKKRPAKVQVYSFVMLICMMFTALAVLLIFAYTKIRGFV